MEKYQRQAGFTLIELLIVIVLIGILAGLVVTTFIVVQKKAQDARTVVLVDAWEKTFQHYVANTGVYPYVSAMDDGSTTFNARFCLGEYPAQDGFDQNACAKTGADPRYTPELNRLMRQKGVNLPQGTAVPVRFSGSSGNTYRGLWIRTNSSEINSYQLYYVLAQKVCAPNDSVGYQATADGTNIEGASAPGTAGRAKVCIRVLPAVN